MFLNRKKCRFIKQKIPKKINKFTRKALTFVSILLVILVLANSTLRNDNVLQFWSEIDSVYFSELESDKRPDVLPEHTWFSLKTNHSDHIYIVDILKNNLKYPEILTLISAQGLINRDCAQIYLDFDLELENNNSFLNFILQHYNLTFEVVSPVWVYYNFLKYLNGTVIYDPNNLDSVNIATIYSGIDNLVIADPEFAEYFQMNFNLSIKYDLRKSPYTSLHTRESVSRWAFENLYAQCNHSMLACLNPEKAYARDFVIKNKLFVYYLLPGPFNLPTEDELIVKILENTPPNIPILGFYKSLSNAEEMYVIEKLSKTGKTLLGGEGVPNLSFTSALTPINPQVPSRSFLDKNLTVENKIYISFAMSDGDNLDFMYHAMKTFWEDSRSENMPISWSVNPAVIELAPPILEYYFQKAKKNDSFICGPSGAGVLFPGFTSEKYLDSYLVKTNYYLTKTGIDTIWLLNGYTPYETPYEQSTLSKYIDKLPISGIALDYGDVPISSNFWIQDGMKNVGVPITRSFHFLKDKSNFMAKIDLLAQTNPKTPNFVFAPIYPWAINITDVYELSEELKNRNSQVSIEIVPLQVFFKMIQKSTVALAKSKHEQLSQRYVNRVFAKDELFEAKKNIDLAQHFLSKGDLNQTAHFAWKAIRILDNLKSTECKIYLTPAIVIAILILIGCIIRKNIKSTFSRLKKRRKTGSSNPNFILDKSVLLLLFFMSTLITIFCFYKILFSDFWNWLLFLSILICYPALKFVNMLIRRYEHKQNILLISSSVMLSACGIMISFLNVMFFLIVTNYIIIAAVCRASIFNEKNLGFYQVGIFFISLSFINLFLKIDYGALILSVINLLVISIFVIRYKKYKHFNKNTRIKNRINSKKSSTYWEWFYVSLFLAFSSFIVFYPHNYYLSLKFDSNVGYLQYLSIILPTSAFIISILVLGVFKSLKGFSLKRLGTLFVVSSLLWLSLIYISDWLLVSASLLLIQIVNVMIILTMFGLLEAKGFDTQKSMRFDCSLICLLAVFNVAYITPIAYYIESTVQFNYVFNYVFYCTPLMFASLMCFILLPCTIIPIKLRMLKRDKKPDSERLYNHN